MNNPKRFMVVLTAVFFSLAIFSSAALAQQKFVLKFNHVLGPKEPYHLGFQKWAITFPESRS
jgi:TRAP-type C4-dicarboxylate transport system substrate-binding protein